MKKRWEEWRAAGMDDAAGEEKSAGETVVKEENGAEEMAEKEENGAGTIAVKEENRREKPYLYWLLNVSGLGKKRDFLLQKLGSAEAVYRASEGALRGILGERTAAKIEAVRKRWDILGEYETLCGQKIKFTCYGDADYPRRLLGIPDPPFVLYYQGELPDDGIPAAALIGARACSEYGAYTAREFGSKLARMGIQIISGLAMGIDGISQEAALDAGGKSFGVLGCGVDICYPKSNRAIYEKCREQGGILSEYPPGTPPASNLFPPRNRIISGLADVVVVLEAREKSGTLITVDMALEQGREVFAVPGRITDSLSRGCNCLFKQGAGVAVSPVDILEAVYRAGGAAKGAIYIEETAREKRGKTPPERAGAETAKLSGQERQVYEQLTPLSKTPDEILEQMGENVTVQEVMGALVELCLKGVAKQTAEGYCQKVLAT